MHQGLIVEDDDSEDVLGLESIDEGVQCGAHRGETPAPHRPGSVDDGNEALPRPGFDPIRDRCRQRQQAGDNVFGLHGNKINVELRIEIHEIPPFVELGARRREPFQGGLTLTRLSFMSRHETPMTRWYWNQVGGLLIEEYMVVSRGAQQTRRLVDGLIVLGEEARIARKRTFDIAARDVIVIQSKNRRLSMPLMGQCLFSRDLVRQLGPSSVRSVALCTRDDATLRPLLEAHEGCEVVVYPQPGLRRRLVRETSCEESKSHIQPR